MWVRDRDKEIKTEAVWVDRKRQEHGLIKIEGAIVLPKQTYVWIQHKYRIQQKERCTTDIVDRGNGSTLQKVTHSRRNEKKRMEMSEAKMKEILVFAPPRPKNIFPVPPFQYVISSDINFRGWSRENFSTPDQVSPAKNGHRPVSISGKMLVISIYQSMIHCTFSFLPSFLVLCRTVRSYDMYKCILFSPFFLHSRVYSKGFLF